MSGAIDMKCAECGTDLWTMPTVYLRPAEARGFCSPTCMLRALDRPKDVIVISPGPGTLSAVGQ